MTRLLVVFCFLACLALIPAMSFAGGVAQAQRQMLESSNADAWKMLEDDASGYSSDVTPNPSPIDDNSADDPFNPGLSDDSYVVESVPPQIPEPATMILLGLGLIGIGTGRRLRK